MDAGVLAAVVGGAAAVGAAVAGPLAVRASSRRLQNAQAEHLAAQTAQLRQDIYQQLTADLRAELDRVRDQLRTSLESLAATSVEAERLRRRVVELESRVAQLESNGRHLLDELAQARAELVEKDAIITGLRGHVASLQQDLTRAHARATSTTEGGTHAPAT